MAILHFFFKILFTLFFIALAGLAFFYLETNVAFTLVALCVAVGLIISYLRSHMIEVEDRDFASHTFSPLSGIDLNEHPIQIKPSLVGPSPKLNLRNMDSFQRTFVEKGLEKAPEPVLAFSSVGKDAKEEGEVKVSLSPRSAGKALAGKKINEPWVAKPPLQNSKTLSDKPFGEEGVKEPPANGQSIFDELIVDKAPFLEEARENPFKSKSPRLKKVQAPAPKVLPKTDALEVDWAGKEPEDLPGILSLESDLESEEVVEFCRCLIQKGQAQEAVDKLGNFLNQPSFSLASISRGEVLFQLGLAKIALADFQGARSHFLECFSKCLPKESANFQTKLEQVVNLYRTHQSVRWAIPFFITLLSYKRQAQDYSGMDELYDDIAQAYSENQEMDRLIETYQNHLAIKNKIKDFTGQLLILDKLGKLYYDKGDQAGSKFCYQKSLEVKRQMLEAR